MKYVAIAFFATTFILNHAFGNCGNAACRDTTILQTNQLIIVLTGGWDSVGGKLYAYQKKGKEWELQFSNRVVVGSKGLGIGDGLTNIFLNGAPGKKEGDKKSPAGIFTIGAAFGYAPYKEVRWIKNHYVQATDTLICVDDVSSAHYNTLVNNDSSKSDWKSYEQMHRRDNFYEWGLFINHNTLHVEPGDGSCIFMHIWENDHEGTVGCTAMEEKNMLRILHWIDKKSNPLLVQMTREAYADICKKFHLPVIPRN
jgi:L,D-peptidoglycan transpeptidase YkuD (ErfK/YbiS/YcfS/YnhG family)